jgi:hypothetical protein
MERSLKSIASKRKLLRPSSVVGMTKNIIVMKGIIATKMSFMAKSRGEKNDHWPSNDVLDMCRSTLVDYHWGKRMVAL